MKVIKEYLLDKNSIMPQTMYLPVRAEPIAVQDTPRGLIMQAISDLTEHNMELRTFKVYLANENIYADRISYIDNFDGPTGRMHVIELLDGNN